MNDRHWSEALSDNGVLVGISSIYWREAWKYGMRVWRYCQHDCGHAIAAVSYAAAALGWQTRLIHSAADDVVAGLLGLDRSEDFGPAEAEAPDALLWVGDPLVPPDLERMRAALDKASWYGRANQLSSGHVQWQDIDSIHRVTHKSLTLERAPPDPGQRTPPAPLAAECAARNISRRKFLCRRNLAAPTVAHARLDAVRLCVEHARQRRPRFDLEAQRSRAVARRFNPGTGCTNSPEGQSCN